MLQHRYLMCRSAGGGAGCQESDPVNSATSPPTIVSGPGGHREGNLTSSCPLSTELHGSKSVKPPTLSCVTDRTGMDRFVKAVKM